MLSCSLVLLLYLVTSYCYPVWLSHLLILFCDQRQPTLSAIQHYLMLLPYAVTWHAVQARQLATELVTVVKQLLELNVKAYQLEVCLNFAMCPLIGSQGSVREHTK